MMPCPINHFLEHRFWTWRCAPKAAAWGVLMDISERLEDWFTRFDCWRLGCDPISDQCGKPDHDYCAWCRRGTPGQAKANTVYTRRVPWHFRVDDWISDHWYDAYTAVHPRQP